MMTIGSSTHRGRRERARWACWFLERCALVIAVTLVILGQPSPARAQEACDWSYSCTTGEDCILCDNGQVCGTYGSNRCQAGTCRPPIPDGELGCRDGGQSCTEGSECHSGICQPDTHTCAPAGMAHIVEVQLATTSPALRDMATWVARELGRDQACGAQLIPCPFGYVGQSGVCAVDRINAPAPGANLSLRYGDTVQTVPNYDIEYVPVMVVLPVEVVVRDGQCLQDANVPCNPQTYLADVGLSLQAQITDAGLELCGTVAQVTVNGLDLANLITLPAPQCFPLTQITRSLGTIGAGIHDIQISANTVNGEIGDRLAVRIWLDENGGGNIAYSTPYLADNYRTFFDGMIAPSPPGSSWSIFLGYQAMQNVAQGAIYGLTQSAFGGRSAGWATTPPTLDASFQHIMLGSVCNVEVKLFTAMAFGLDAAAHQTTLDLSVDADVDLTGCIFTFLNPIIDGLIDYMVNAWDLGTFGLPLFDGASCTFNMSELPFTVHCVAPNVIPPTTPFPGGPALGASIDHVTGVDNGLVVGGSFTATPAGPELLATFGAESLAYSWNGSCTAPQTGWFTTISAEGAGELCGPPEVLDDPFGICIVDDPDPQNTQLPKYFTVRYAWDVPSYACNVVVRTTGGSTMLTISPPAAPASPLDVVGSWADVFANCNPISGVVPGKWDPHWDVDPPWDPYAVLHIGPQGEPVLGKVRIVSAKLQSIGPVQRSTSDFEAVDLYKHALRLTADALVEGEGFDAFVVPLSVDIVANFSGDRFPAISDRFVGIKLLETIEQPIHVSSRLLPANVRSLDFDLVIQQESMTLYAELPAENLRASWVFDEGDGSGEELDMSGHANTCEVVGQLSVVSGVRGDARGFDSFAFATCPSTEWLGPAEQITLSAWVKTHESSLYFQSTIVSKEWIDDEFVQYALRIKEGGFLRFTILDVSLDGSTLVTPNQWHHVVATYDGADMRLYLDGALDASWHGAASLEDTGVPVFIGASAYDNPSFNGVIDEVRIYDRALTSAEVMSPYW